MFRSLMDSYGLPMMIDLADCDRNFPSIYDYVPGVAAEDANKAQKPFLMNHWSLSLAILLGRVLKLLYSACKPDSSACARD